MDSNILNNLCKDNDSNTSSELSIIERFEIVNGSGNWQEPYDWLIEGLIPAKSIGLLGGPAASGKTFAAIELIGSVISGQPAFDVYPVAKSGAALYCTMEGQQGIAHRLEAYRVDRNIDKSIWNSSLFQTSRYFNFKTINPTDFAKLIREIESENAIKIRLVIFDTFRVYSGVKEENSSGEVQHALSWARQVKQLANCTVLLVHHSGKKINGVTLKPGAGFDELLRGSSDLGGSAEFVIGVMKHLDQGDRARHYLWTAKLKDAPLCEPVSFDLEEASLTINNKNSVATAIVSKNSAASQVAPKISKPGRDHKTKEYALKITKQILESNSTWCLKEIKDAIRQPFCNEEISADGIKTRVNRTINYLKDNAQALGLKVDHEDQNLTLSPAMPAK